MLSFDEFCDVLLDRLRVPAPPGLGPEADLYSEVALDSFQAFEMLIVIEATAGLDIPPAQIPEIYTLGDAYEYYLHAAELAAQV